MRKPNNLSARLLSSRLAHGDDTAFCFQDSTLSHQDLWMQARAAAANMLAQGLAPRDSVLFVMDDRPQWPVLFHAMILMGAVPIVAMPGADLEYLEHICHTAKPKWAIGDESALEPLQSRVSVTAPWQSLCQGSEVLPLGQIYEYDKLDAWVILTSSGTTGSPKLIVHRHEHLEQTFTRFNPFEFKKQHRVLCSVKMASSFGLIMTVLGAPAIGMTMVVLDTPAAYREFDHVMQQHRVTHAMLTPRMIAFLLRHQTQFHSELEAVYATGEALNLAMAQEFKDRFGFTVYDSYGCGEVRTWALLLNHGSTWRRGSLGLPAAGTVCRILNDQGMDCSMGEIGELHVHHANVAMGYFGDIDLTQTRFRDGWLATGDYVSRDLDGYLYYAGRREQLVATHNGFLSCLDLENRINQLPGVTDCVVIIDQTSIKSFVQTHDEQAWQHIRHSGIGDEMQWYRIDQVPFTVTHKKVRQESVLMQHVISPQC